MILNFLGVQQQQPKLLEDRIVIERYVFAKTQHKTTLKIECGCGDKFNFDTELGGFEDHSQLCGEDEQQKVKKKRKSNVQASRKWRQKKAQNVQEILNQTKAINNVLNPSGQKDSMDLKTAIDVLKETFEHLKSS